MKAKIVICDGESHTLKEWSKISGTKIDTIQFRLRKGWEPHKAIFQKPLHVVQRRHPECTEDCDHCIYPDCVASAYTCVGLMSAENDGITPGGEPKEVPGSWMKHGRITKYGSRC